MHRTGILIFLIHFFNTIYTQATFNENDTTPYSANLLSRYIRHASISGNERMAGSFFSTMARQKGFHMEILTDEPASFNSTASLYPLEKGNPNIVLLNYIDVVPVTKEVEHEYTYPPFSGIIADGKVWGRGAIDNKGMGVMQIFAMEQFLERSFQFLHLQALTIIISGHIFLSWSPKLEDHNGIPTGRLSGIANHHVPNYLKKRQLLSWEVNCITDWEKKLILNTNAGMWEYNIGDTVEFVSTDPYRIIVNGRIGQFISAFGEHVIAEEVESAIGEVCENTGAGITEFTVAPLMDNPGGRHCHEWLIEFSQVPLSIEDFSREPNLAMRNKNSDYNDLMEGKIMQPLVIREMPLNSFANYMDSIGKLGGQSKVPHLRNDWDMSDALYKELSRLK
jgi:hypothetical protein